MINDKPCARLWLGNEAIAHAALDAGVGFVSSYPGTPSSEVVETLLRTRNDNSSSHPVIEYSINEKVAYEAACGAALAGVPSLAVMKHVGVNVAADPLFTSAYIGLPGGLVLLSADDPGCHSSQNEQDNRYYARAAHLPCFEPVSSQEAYEMTLRAFAIARQLEQPVMLRTVTRVNHERAPVTVCGSAPLPRVNHKPNGNERVPVPMVARKRREILREHMEKAALEAETGKFNTVFWPDSPVGAFKHGIIASGMARAYLHDALMELDLLNTLPILALGMTWPLPENKIREFAARCENILILEEGENLLESGVKTILKNQAPNIEGKGHSLSPVGEFSTSGVKLRLIEWLGLNKDTASPGAPRIQGLAARAPNLCPGCAHRSVYYAARKVFGDDVTYSSDIGCYTLGLLPPLRTADFALCMGASISAGSGYAAVSQNPVVAFIGDSTFFHSGITGLANAVFNKRNLLLIILDNGTTAMTGHQPHPGAHQALLGSGSCHLDLEAICKGLGITQFKKVRSHNLKAMSRTMEEFKHLQGVRVIHAQEPCLLFARSKLRKKAHVVAEVVSQNEAGEKCLQDLACPAFMRKDGKLAINEDLCGGCLVCAQIAPTAFKARKAAL